MSEENRRAILARRSRFMMLALASAGIASSAIDCDGDTTDTSAVGGTAGSGGTPQPCLTYPGGSGGFGGASGAAAGDAGGDAASEADAVDGDASESDAGCIDTDPVCGPDAGSGSCEYLPDDSASGCVQVTDTIGCPAWVPRLFACAAAVPLHCCINPGIAPAADAPTYRCCS